MANYHSNSNPRRRYDPTPKSKPNFTHQIPKKTEASSIESPKSKATLVQASVDDVTIDVDPFTGGIVLDRGELTKMKAKNTDSNKVKEIVDNIIRHQNQPIPPKPTLHT